MWIQIRDLTLVPYHEFGGIFCEVSAPKKRALLERWPVLDPPSHCDAIAVQTLLLYLLSLYYTFSGPKFPRRLRSGCIMPSLDLEFPEKLKKILNVQNEICWGFLTHLCWDLRLENNVLIYTKDKTGCVTPKVPWLCSPCLCTSCRGLLLYTGSETHDFDLG